MTTFLINTPTPWGKTGDTFTVESVSRAQERYVHAGVLTIIEESPVEDTAPPAEDPAVEDVKSKSKPKVKVEVIEDGDAS